MNNYNWLSPRHRQRHLFIVEGNHEKNELIELLLKSFPEIDISLDDILIYGTNIYQLYYDIVKEYPDGWYDQEIDLPFIVGKKKGHEQLHKNDFTNIILIFDYERHDPSFSEEKITEMQLYFQDATDVGQLYLNYPMIESYQHLQQIPDDDYINRKISVSCQPGHCYKNIVKDMMINKAINLPVKLRSILMERFHLTNDESIQYTEQLLNIKDSQGLVEQIEIILSDSLEGKDLTTAKNQLADSINRYGYLNSGLTYYKFMRKLFSQIICHNIWKANRIQRGVNEIAGIMIKECFFALDLEIILQEQNKSSRDVANGCIWVLNTCVFFVPDYNFGLIEAAGYP